MTLSRLLSTRAFCSAFQTLMEGKGDKATAEGMELLRKEVEKMKEELKTSEEGLCTFPRENIGSGSALEEK